jgi:hypothetical protein
MTGQSLFYVGESDLAHKVLAIAEEEGASRAAYALKLLQSEGEISIASTGKDTATGRLVTHTYRVSGPTAIVLTTTSIEIDEELLNRCLVLTVDEDRAQTRAIHDRQRQAQTLTGLQAAVEREQVLTLHRNAQRLLEPLAVVNPFADRLTFTDTATRTRRDHVKYLTLITAVTLLHQHQRRIKTTTAGIGSGTPVRYVETTVADIALANRLAHAVLGQSLDELRRAPAGCWTPCTATFTPAARPTGWTPTWSGSPAGSCANSSGSVTPSSRSTWPGWSTSSWSCHTGWRLVGSATSWPGTPRSAAVREQAGGCCPGCSTPPPSSRTRSTGPTLRLRHPAGRGPRRPGRGLVGPWSGPGRGLVGVACPR